MNGIKDMAPVVAFDTETHLILPGLLAPPMVCLQYQRTGCNPCIFHRDDPRTKDAIREWLSTDAILVGHNVAFDMAVIAAQWPDLLPAIIAKYDRDEVSDTMLREQLICIALGKFRHVQYARADGTVDVQGVKYSLADCYNRHFGKYLKKEGFRLFYRLFDDLTNTEVWGVAADMFQQAVRRGDIFAWLEEYLRDGIVTDAQVKEMLAAAPEEALSYALKDATVTLELYEDQERIARANGWLEDEFRQARAAFALHLSSCWGLYTDPEAVDLLERDLNVEFDQLKADLQAEGIIREDGSADTTQAKARMVAECAAEGLPIATTKGGDTSLSAEACNRFDEDSVIGQYSRFLKVRKTLSNDIKMLRAGCEVPIQTRYGMADTGRATSSGPNIMAINRGAGIREAFRPRPGTVFAQADFEGLELHTLAQWCLTVVGHSELAKLLNAKQDVHIAMAAELLNITYDEAIERKAAGDLEIKDKRQAAKPINFGYPGGLGAKKFVRFARAQYKIEFTEEEARQVRAKWLGRFPEMNEHFRLAAQATANGDATETHIFSGRVRGGVRYSALCNGRFQGLGADCAKMAMWEVTKACYAQTASPLYGCRVVAFVHDEIILEVPDDQRASPAAKELGRVMCAAANVFLPDVPVRTEPLLMAIWSKSAKPLYDEDGNLKVWRP